MYTTAATVLLVLPSLVCTTVLAIFPTPWLMDCLSLLEMLADTLVFILMGELFRDVFREVRLAGWWKEVNL